MKILTVCVLGSAMMFLAKAAAPPEAKAENNQTVRSQLVKRSTYYLHGWSQINGRYFRYVPYPMTWALAEKHCQSMGGNLASVRNAWEYHKIQRLILYTTHDYKQAWIGGSDAQQENVWLWSDGTTFHYTNWCRGEPNNFHRQQHCLQMNHGDRKCWDDLQCYRRHPFVCAKKRR